ncbi:MAG: ribosome maturation factor RimP [Clostridiales bacterium]|nr:ribosome maturation factor RimP [Candidatus Equinaster intestinalis]
MYAEYDVGEKSRLCLLFPFCKGQVLKLANVAAKVYELLKAPVEQTGITLWDVKFLKEGASYYLRVFIDKAGGIGIDDCTEINRIIDPIIDEADPIENSYYLEVCSCGLGRELTRDWHFEKMLGQKVKVKLYKAVGGAKEISGELKSYDGGVCILGEAGEIYFEKKDFSGVFLDDIDF